MSSAELSRKIEWWIGESHFGGDVSLVREKDGYVVTFVVVTTKTRASSIVTRVRLIVAELAAGQKFLVTKSLVAGNPRAREALGSWKISVAVPLHRKTTMRAAG